LSKRRSDVETEEVRPAQIISFVIRVWREETIPEKSQTIWRGHITPLPNGKRHYFSDIVDVPRFIDAHLKEQR
jgi:hypothetical protein